MVILCIVFTYTIVIKAGDTKKNSDPVAPLELKE